MTTPVQIDVIIPTLNRLPMLKEAIDSLIAQSFKGWQLTVADNGSTDGTQDWLTQNKIHWVSESIKGAGAARLAGLGATSAPFVFFFDSDDLLTADALQALYQNSTATGVDICFGAAKNEVIGGASRIHDPVRLVPAPISSTSLVRRTTFEKYGLFGTDNFSWARWYLDAKSAGLTEHAIPELVAIRRIHDHNVSHDAEAKAFFFTLIRERLAAGKAVKTSD